MPSVSIYFVSAALEALSSSPEIAQRLLLKHHISPILLETPSARVPGEDFSNLLTDIMFETGDEMVGHSLTAQPLGSWATMSQLCISSDTLDEALRRLARFYRLLNWGIKTRLHVDETEVVFFLDEDNNETTFSPYLYESFLFYVYRFCNWLIDRQIPLIEVDFCFPPQPQRTEYPHLFFTNKFHFNQKNSGFTFLKSYLKEPLRQDSQSLKKFLEKSNLTLVTQSYRYKNWQNNVQKILAKNIQDNPGITEVSQALNIHPHTLRKHLQKEGVQFREIKDHLRMEIAINMLTRQKISVESISQKLGFSETSAFTRAFRNWMGVSPFSYRKSHD